MKAELFITSGLSVLQLMALPKMRHFIICMNLSIQAQDSTFVHSLRHGFGALDAHAQIFSLHARVPIRNFWLFMI